MKPVLALALCFVLGCSKPAAPRAPVEVPVTPAAAQFGTSSITGKVTFKGDTPRPAAIKVNADPYCAAAHGDKMTSEEVLINSDGTLRNVLVYVKQGIAGKYPAPMEAAVIDQNGCLYRPRVQGMQTGQALLIRNSDDTLHNIQCLAEKNAPFNIGQPVRGMEAKKMFTQSEIPIRFKCDVHSWMTAYIAVLDHPFFAVTGEGGTFTIPKLPAGEYIIEAWHEKFGTRQENVTLTADETKTIAFEFTL